MVSSPPFITKSICVTSPPHQFRANNNNNIDDDTNNDNYINNEKINQNEIELKTANCDNKFIDYEENDEDINDSKSYNTNTFGDGGEEESNIKKKKPNKFLGIIIVILIAVFLTTSSELSQFLVAGDYNAPFMIIWFNTSFLAISLVIEFILIKIELKKEKKEFLRVNFGNVNGNDQLPTISHQQTVLQRFKSKFQVEYTTNIDTGKTSISKGITIKRLFIISIPMSILFVSLNWVWMLGLSMCEVSIATALYQSASVFCFIFSIVILKEKIRILKTISVVVFMAGIVCIAVTTFGINDGHYPNALTGELLMILSAFLWALYEVLTNKFVGEANRTIVNTFIGFIALINIVIGIPVIIIFNFTGLEKFQIPDGNLFGMLFLNAIISLIMNYLINIGLSVTSPLFVRSGELMSIPATLVFDLSFKNMKLPITAIPGYILIVIGFILSVFVEKRQIDKKERLEKIELKQQEKPQQEEVLQQEELQEIELV